MRILHAAYTGQGRILIESQWNLNDLVLSPYAAAPVILIESQWNLNLSPPPQSSGG